MTVAEQARQLQELRDRKDADAATAKQSKEAYDRAERRFFDALDGMGVGSIKVDGVLYVPTATVYGTVQDKEAFSQWAEMEMPELLEPKPRAQLINELVRERLDTGQELPPGVGFYSREYVSARIS